MWWMKHVSLSIVVIDLVFCVISMLKTKKDADHKLLYSWHWCHSNMDKAVRRPWPIHYWICKITASTPSTLWQHPMWLRCFLFWSQWIFNWCFSTLRANIELPRVTQDSDSLQKSHTKLKYARGKWTTVFWDKEKNAILFNILYPLCRWTGYWS